MSLRSYKPYPEYRDSGVEWLGEIPAHWGVKRLKYLTRIVAGQSPPSTAVSDGTDGLAFLQGNADFGRLSPVPRQVCDAAPKRAEVGDILLSVRAPVGAMNIADQSYGIGRGLCAIRPNNSFERSFCFYGVMAVRPLLTRVAAGSTYDAVTASDIGHLLLLNPPPSDQRAIAAFLDRETARIDGLVAKKERLCELLQEKRTALITRAVTKGLDPNVPMKDSGVEWLGEIPAHWGVKRLKFVLGAPLKYGANEVAELDDPNLPRYVRITDIDESDGLRDETFKSLPANLAEEYLLRPGDLLFARSGAMDKIKIVCVHSVFFASSQ